jgi:hypothetical protein
MPISPVYIVFPAAPYSPYYLKYYSAFLCFSILSPSVTLLEHKVPECPHKMSPSLFMGSPSNYFILIQTTI